MATVLKFPSPSERERRQSGDRRSPLRPDTSKCRPPVSGAAMDWCWTQPVDGPRLLVLLALAKRVRPKTDQATPSMPELVHMTGMSETTIRGHVQALARAKVIEVAVSNGGRHQRSVYTLPGVLTPRSLWGSKPTKTPRELTPRDPETPQELGGSEATETPQIPRQNPPTDEPVVLRTKSEQEVVREATADADAAAQTSDDAGLFDEPVTDAGLNRKRVKVAQAIASRYCELEPMSKYVSVLGIVKRPLENDRFSGETVMAAVEQLAKEQRPLTLETLRVQLVGFPARDNGHRNGRAPLRQRLRNGGGAA